MDFPYIRAWVAAILSAYLFSLVAAHPGGGQSEGGIDFAPRAGLRHHPRPFPLGPEEPRPSYYLYVWCSPDDAATPDFVATFAATSLRDGQPPTYLGRTVIPTRGNEAHHVSVSRDGRILFAGGLLSFRHDQASNFFFDLRNPARPRYLRSSRPPNGVAADAAYSLSNGGFLVTMMGGRERGAGGRVVEYDAQLNLVGEYPRRAHNVPAGFHPHGLAVDEAHNLMVTSDYVDPHSTLHPTSGVLTGNTVRVWDFAARRITHTLLVNATAQGVMDVALVGTTHNCPGCVIASSVSDGRLYLVDPLRGHTQVAFDSGIAGAGFHVLMTNRRRDRLWVTAALTGAIYMLDVSDPYNVRSLSVLQMGATATPHFITLSPDEATLVVSDYFVDQHDFGVVRCPGDKVVHFVALGTSSMEVISAMDLDFKILFPDLGVVNPHGMALVPTSIE
ncbi:hypothetical protein IWQ60_006821 [Tieghemiomyces parasiticus]|uniref:Methanethiol oxidase n=1 Tax=Tieghemiomyces parasiticus TaxID=78921 RepID=A0A9W8A228_9FUNG|nr:hypothetical protein IWQ60_006821 [Tieghemiomyces parasiticus]